MAADSSFNAQCWLKAAGFLSYTAAAITGHGYVNYESCINISEDARAVVKREERQVSTVVDEQNKGAQTVSPWRTQ